MDYFQLLEFVIQFVDCSVGVERFPEFQVLEVTSKFEFYQDITYLFQPLQLLEKYWGGFHN